MSSNKTEEPPKENSLTLDEGSNSKCRNCARTVLVMITLGLLFAGYKVAGGTWRVDRSLLESPVSSLARSKRQTDNNQNNDDGFWNSIFKDLYGALEPQPAWSSSTPMTPKFTTEVWEYSNSPLGGTESPISAESSSDPAATFPEISSSENGIRHNASETSSIRQSLNNGIGSSSEGLPANAVWIPYSTVGTVEPSETASPMWHNEANVPKTSQARNDIIPSQTVPGQNINGESYPYGYENGAISAGTAENGNMGEAMNGNIGQPNYDNQYDNIGRPMNANPGQPWNDNMGQPTDNNMGQPVNDNMGQPTDNNMGQPMSDNMGQPLNDNLGQPMTDNMGQPTDNNMGQPLSDNMGQPLNDNMGQPTDNNMGQPLSDNMGQPMNNYMGQPNYQPGNAAPNADGTTPLLPSWMDPEFQNTFDGNALGLPNQQVNPTDWKPQTEDPCYSFTYEVNKVCEMSNKQQSMFGSSLSMEDITALIFDSLTIDTLMTECTNGTWCLGTSMDRAMYRDVSHSILDLCPLKDCLLDAPDACVSEERRITISTLMLLCKTKEANFSSPVACSRSILKMSHVTLANLRRKQFGHSEGICKEINMFDCTGSCRKLAQQLRCMCTNCEHRFDLFDEYGPWQWYFAMENSMDKCNLDSIDCSMFQESPEPFYQSWWSRLETMDTTTVSAVTLACVISLLGIIAMIIICIRRGPKYHRKKVHYKEVSYDDDDDADDEDENVLAQFIP